jgi:hypothetical protein
VSPGEVVKNQFMTPGTHPFRGQDRVVHQLDDRLLDGFNRIGNDKAFPKWQVVGGLLPTSVIEQKCCRKLAFWPGVQTCWLGSVFTVMSSMKRADMVGADSFLTPFAQGSRKADFAL